MSCHQLLILLLFLYSRLYPCLFGNLHTQLAFDGDTLGISISSLYIACNKMSYPAGAYLFVFSIYFFQCNYPESVGGFLFQPLYLPCKLCAAKSFYLAKLFAVVIIFRVFLASGKINCVAIGSFYLVP